VDITKFQSWVKKYYQERGWSDLDIFIRIGFLAEETGEVARAIRALEVGRDRPDEKTATSEELKQELVEELGDVLLQVIFHSEIAEEEGNFSIYDVMSTLGNKLIYRHPHVFLKKEVENSKEVVYNWNMLKYAKRNITSFTDKLKDIPKLPSLMTSYKIQEKAAEIGFDWEDIRGPLDKVIEEYKEVIEAMEKFQPGHEKIEDEIGDLLFAIVNLSRFLKVNPEVALNRTINKFIHRFEFMEKSLEGSGKTLEDMTLEEMDKLWDEAKLHKIH